jgi:AcrR family transcriptional regulator
MASTKRGRWRGEPLRPHILGIEEVRAHQRDRIARAILECVAVSGYQSTTVAAIATTARVSPNAFYEFFADRADGFLTVAREAAIDLLNELLATREEQNWIGALNRGFDIYLRSWGARPAFGRAYFLGLPELGEPGRALLNEINDAYAAMFRDLGRRARLEQPRLPPLPEIVPRAIVSVVYDLVVEHVRKGQGNALIKLHAPLFSLSLRLLADDQTATAVLAQASRVDLTE